MEVTCEHCTARLNIPDGKLPPNRRIAVNCPKCTNQITIDTGGQDRGQPPADIRRPEPEAARPEPQEPAGPEDGRDDQDDSVLDIFEEGKKLAIVMGRDPSQNETFKAAAQGLGFQCVPVENSREAIGKLRFHHFDLILLADGFDGKSAAESPVTAHLNRQSMAVRRKMFVALTGGTFKTTDNMTAYALSANLVVNERDLDKLGGVLKTSMAENEKFYKVFMDTLGELGRA